MLGTTILRLLAEELLGRKISFRILNLNKALYAGFHHKTRHDSLMELSPSWERKETIGKTKT
jgi:hypothetical protein